MSSWYTIGWDNPGWTVNRPVVSGSYTGPGDIVTAIGWWGLRAYSNSSIGSNVIQLRRSSDNATTNFVSVSGGGINTASVSTWAGTSTLFITTLYDQTASGNNLTQSTTSEQPTLLLNQLNGLPAMSFTGAGNGQFLITAGNTPTTAQPYTMAGVFNCSSAVIYTPYAGVQNLTASNYMIFGEISGNAQALVLDYSNNSTMTVSNTGNAWNSVIAVISGASSSLYDNGTDSGLQTLPTGAADGGVILGAKPDGVHVFNGSGMELGLWSTSSMSKTTMSNNIRNYYGF